MSEEEREEPWVAPRREVVAAAVDYVEKIALHQASPDKVLVGIGGRWVRLRKAVEAYQEALPGKRGVR